MSSETGQDTTCRCPQCGVCSDVESGDTCPRCGAPIEGGALRRKISFPSWRALACFGYLFVLCWFPLWRTDLFHFVSSHGFPHVDYWIVGEPDLFIGGRQITFNLNLLHLISNVLFWTGLFLLVKAIWMQWGGKRLRRALISGFALCVFMLAVSTLASLNAALDFWFKFTTTTRASALLQSLGANILLLPVRLLGLWSPSNWRVVGWSAGALFASMAAWAVLLVGLRAGALLALRLMGARRKTTG